MDRVDQNMLMIEIAYCDGKVHVHVHFSGLRQELGLSYWFCCLAEIGGFLGSGSRFLVWNLCNLPALIL